VSQDFKLTWKGREALAEIEAALPDALFAAGQQIIDVASAKAPRGATGDLRRSGYVTMQGRSTYRHAKNHRKEAKPKPGTVAVAFAVFYAGFVEYGTRKMAAHPFFRPTVDELKTRLGLTIALKMKGKLK
jgi:HK97 gp10 family phage protein